MKSKRKKRTLVCISCRVSVFTLSSESLLIPSTPFLFPFAITRLFSSPPTRLLPSFLVRFVGYARAPQDMRATKTTCSILLRPMFSDV